MTSWELSAGLPFVALTGGGVRCLTLLVKEASWKGRQAKDHLEANTERSLQRNIGFLS
jgi:hypothetical protein